MNPQGENETIRVGLRGARGRMGQEVAGALGAALNTELVSAVDLGDEAGEAFRKGRVQVAVDFTTPAALEEGVPAMLGAGCAVVVGTSGVQAHHLEAWAGLAEQAGTAVLVVPNFCIGVVLLQRFATAAARYYGDVEILEMHHEKKVDSPSGTAADTARRIAMARGEAHNTNLDESRHRGGRVDGIPVHSVRLPGLLAHQVVWFGGTGEVLSLRHDSMDRRSFMPGVLAAVRGVRGLKGVHVGLEHCLADAGGTA